MSDAMTSIEQNVKSARESKRKEIKEESQAPINIYNFIHRE